MSTLKTNKQTIKQKTDVNCELNQKKQLIFVKGLPHVCVISR